MVRGAAPAPRAGDSVSMLSIRPHLAGTGEATAAGMKLADDDDDDEVSEGQGEWAWAQRRAAALGGSRHFAAIVVVAVIIVPIAAFTVN